MGLEVRGALRAEYPLVRQIISQAFRTQDEAQLSDYLVAYDRGMKPEGVRVAVLDGDPVACTVVLQRQVQARTGRVPGAIVTLVACRPALQNRGYGGATVRDAVHYMGAEGLSVGLLYGHPEYYPRFGFVPVLPHTATRLPVPGGPDQPLRPASAADYPALLALYDAELGGHPCAVWRTAQPWLWQVRNVEENALLIRPDRKGYALVTASIGGDELYVGEAAGDVMAGLLTEARRRGRPWLHIGLPPGHALVQQALAMGATQAYHPAGAGMAVVTRWEPLLPADYRADDQGLWRGDRLLLSADRQTLTQMVLGYTGGAGELAADFPPRYPRLSLAPFWH